MATQINGTTGRNSSYWRYYLVCTEQDVNIANNTSKLKVDVYLGATSYSRAVRGSVSATHTVNVNGTNYTFTTGAYTIEKNTNVLLGSITTNAITHDADGSKKVSVTASSPDLAQASGYGPYSGSVSGTVTLTTIPRTSSVTCADGNIGSATTINIVRASNTFTHTLTYSFGTLKGTIVTKTKETSIGWTIPTSFYTMIPNSSVGQGAVFCETYSGDTLIGTTSCLFNAIVLEVNNKPTITATVVDTNATTTALTGDANKLVKYFSNAKVTITATAKNSATIVSQKVTCGDGKSSTLVTDTLYAVESGTFNLSCVDSRGFVGTNTITKTMINYIKLAITSLSIKRVSSTSNTVNISLKGNYFNSSFGSVANTLSLKWRYRLQGGTWSGYTTVTATKSGNTFSYSGTLGTTFDYQQAYEFEIVAQDKLITDTKIQPVTKGTPLVDIWKDNFKVNGNIIGNASSSTKAGYYWSTVTQGQIWSRICFIAPVRNTMGFSGILTLTCTRNAVVCNYTFLVNSSHSNSVGLVQINSTKYSTLRIRALGHTHGNCVIEILDTINNVASGTSQNWYCSFTPLAECNLTKYTTFTDGTTLPSGYVVSADFTTNNSNNIQSERGVYFPVVNLYNNTTGTNGTITDLNETVANFSYIEIFYRDQSSPSEYSSVKIYSPNNKRANLLISTSNSELNGFWHKQKTVSISGTSISNLWNCEWDSNNNVLQNYNLIYIVRVDGYR